MSRKIIGILFLLSGAAGLIYQVVWSRSLTLLFGSTTLAVSTVITAFMAGLGLGSWLFGRYADRVKKALPLYAALEIGIAVLAILFPFFLKVITPLFFALSKTIGDSYVLFPLARFALCFVGLLFPTVLMGGTLPAMTRFFVKERATFGGNVSVLYALNTFGAMIGCFTAGFFLIPYLGIDGTVALAVGLNLTAAIGALLLSRVEKEQKAERPENRATAIDGATDSGRAGSTDDSINPGIVLLIFAVAGFTSLAYEVLWTRALLFFLGWFAVYAFTIILTTFLFGLAVGSAAYPLLFRKGKNLLLAFAVIEIVIGIFGALSVPIFSGLFEVIRSLEESLPRDNWWHFIIARAGGSFAVMLVPTFLMGLTFPLASAIYARAGKGYGATIGNVYASNSLGAILGSMATGFLLLPLLGLGQSMALIALLNLLLGGSILLLRARRSRSRVPAFAMAVLLLAAGGANFAFSSDRPMVLSSRHFKDPDRPMRLLYSSEGATASLAVLHDVNSGHVELNINGESTAYTTYTDMQVHLMLSHLPLLFVENPKKVLVIGFGLGSTSYGATLHPSVEEVRCIELVPKEVETAEFFESVNHGVLRSPKFKLTIDDGRNFIFRTEEKFDLISFNAIHPSHSPALYTVEFYRECAKKMTDAGAICAWVPNNSFTERQFQILLRTFQSVFPHSSLWYVNPNHLVLIGTRQRHALDFDDFRRRVGQEPVRTELANYTMEDPYQLLAYHLMDEKDLEIYTSGVPVNSDSKPYLEYSRELYTRIEIIDAMQYHRSSILPYMTIANDSAAVVDTLREYEKAAYHLLAAQSIYWIESKAPDLPGRVWRIDIELAEAMRLTPGQRNLLAISGIRETDKGNLSSQFENRPDNTESQRRLLRLYRLQGDWDHVRETLNAVRGVHTTSTTLEGALLHFENGELESAATAFRAVASGDSPVLGNVGSQYLQITDYELRRKTGESLNTDEMLALANSYWTVGDRDRGEVVFQEAIAQSTGLALPLLQYGQAMENAYRIDEAAELYKAALELPIARTDLKQLIAHSLERTRIQIAMREKPNEVQSIEVGDRVIPIDPASSAFRMKLGLLHMERRDVSRAAIELRLAVMLDGKNVEARLNLGRALAFRGLEDEAEEEFRVALAIDPDRADIRQEISRLRRTRVEQ